jgi:nucleoside-diphosphate-sugar epimerase
MWRRRCSYFVHTFSWGHVNPIGPRACYDEGKRVAETLAYGFQRQDGVDIRVARIFNTYGKYIHVSKCYVMLTLQNPGRPSQCVYGVRDF